MEIKFNISDELTVTNKTVRIHAQVTGQSGSDTREEINKRIIEACNKFIPTDWTYSDFKYAANGMTFSSQAYCRIPASDNDKLENKTSLVNDNFINIFISNIDASIPSYDIRDAESKLRSNIIKLCQKECEKLDGKLVSVDFTNRDQGFSPQKSLVASAYSDQHNLGHSQKIAMSAEVTVVLN